MSRGFLRKSNGADGPAQWVYKNVTDKLIARYQLTVNNKRSIYSLLELACYELALSELIT